jgi:hypothetical protein
MTMLRGSSVGHTRRSIHIDARQRVKSLLAVAPAPRLAFRHKLNKPAAAPDSAGPGYIDPTARKGYMNPV